MIQDNYTELKQNLTKLITNNNKWLMIAMVSIIEILLIIFLYPLAISIAFKCIGFSVSYIQGFVLFLLVESLFLSSHSRKSSIETTEEHCKVYLLNIENDARLKLIFVGLTIIIGSIA